MEVILFLTGQKFARRDLENLKYFDWLLLGSRYEHAPFA
jgi:hypothetical protein